MLKSVGAEKGDASDVQFEHLVRLYDPKKFCEDHPPSLTFAPSKLLMKKMMRVAAECKDLNDLNYLF